MSATNFKVGDVVKMSDIGKKNYKEHRTNPYTLTGIVEDVGGVYVRWSNGELNSYTRSELELVESKQEQYYTSIPTDVKVGDKFVVCCNLDIGTGKTKFPYYGIDIDSIVTLKEYKKGSTYSHFSNEKNEFWNYDWGWLKPVKDAEYKADTPDVQQFNIGDEVELIEDYDQHKKGTKGIVTESTESIIFFKICGTDKGVGCYHKRLKLINNNKTTNNNGKVHSNNTNDIFTAFSPDIRSKEICAGQVFSEFNLPQIWTGH